MTDDELAQKLAALLYDRTQLVRADAEDLADEILKMVQPPQLWQYKIRWSSATLIHNEDFVGTEDEANARVEEIKKFRSAKLRSVRRRRTVDPTGDRYNLFEEVEI